MAVATTKDSRVQGKPPVITKTVLRKHDDIADAAVEFLRFSERIGWDRDRSLDLFGIGMALSGGYRDLRYGKGLFCYFNLTSRELNAVVKKLVEDEYLELWFDRGVEKYHLTYRVEKYPKETKKPEKPKKKAG